MTKGFMITPVEVDDGGNMRKVGKPEAAYPLEDGATVIASIKHGVEQWRADITLTRGA